MSILATDKKLISFGTDYSAGSGISIIDHTISIVPSAVGKTYSAGPNIGIYDVSGQPTISSKDWSSDIANASANSYTQSTSYFNDWVNGQYTGDIANITNNITALSGDLSSYYKKTETSSKEQINDALQYVSANAGKVYEGISPIVVNNTQDKISADTWTLSAGDGISFTDDSANKVTRIDVTAQGGDEGVNLFVTENSASIIDVNNSYKANSGAWNEVSAKVDSTALIPTIDSNTISYSSKPTDSPIYASDNDLKNVNSIQGKSNLAIVPNGVLQVPNIITAAHGILHVPNAITATNGGLTVQNTISAVPNNTLNVPGVITSNPDGLTANGLSANITGGLTANGLTADAVHSGFSAIGISAGKSGPLFIEGMYESIYANTATGFTFSSQNTALGTAQLGIAQGNSVVQMYAPMFEARNISGAGFSIEASGAKGYDESGNVVWDTSNPKVKNIISYSDTKTAQGGLNGNIILTTQPSTNASNLTNSPYVIMDAMQASYFAAYGPSAQTPTVKLVPGTITVGYEAGNAKTTVGYNDVKQELSGSSWTLTGSIQKRELEYDSNTSAITAINGSALAGQGGGASDTFYIYPGKTTDKEISENSGKDLKLYNSANNVFLDFAGKSTLSKYTMFSFKEITGTQANQNTVQHLRLRVYPNATSACKVYDTNTVNLLDSNSTVSTAQTAYYDGDGNSLTQTHSELTALNSFVQSNSANWGGGSSPTGGDKVLFYKDFSYDPINGSQNIDTFVSGATELYFEAAVDSQQSTPSEIVLYRNGNEIGRAYWSQVSSDGYNNYLTASYNNADGGNIQIPNYNSANYSNFVVSANGVKTLVFYQDSFDCATDKEVKFNIIGSNNVGQIYGWLQGNITPLTSFTASLTDFTAKGYDKYDTNITYEDGNNSYNYLVSAEFGGNGSTQQEVSHDNTLSGNGVADSPLGVILSATNDANVNNIVVTASLPSTPDANTLYLIPEA